MYVPRWAKFILGTLYVASALLLAWGQIFNADSFSGPVLSGINETLQNPGWLGFIALLLITLVPKSLWFRTLRLQRWENYDLRQSVLRAIGEEIFDDRMGNVRVSLLGEVGWFRNWKLQRNRSRESGGRFIEVKQRYSGERRGHESRTAFFQHNFNPDNSEGIAATSMSKQTTIAVESLPNIEEIHLGTVDLESDSEDAKLVRTYMENTRIGRIETLKSINRLPRHIIACPVYDDDGHPISALVIDSMREKSFLNAETKAKIETYANVLSQTYN